MTQNRAQEQNSMMPSSPIKSIRAKCLDCMCNNAAEVRRCPSVDCPLYPYRMGHRPKKEETPSN